MKIRFRFGYRDIRDVDVRDQDCPKLQCFYPATHTIRSAVGMSGCGSRTTDWWECGRRDARGCPSEAYRTIEAVPRFKRVRGAWEYADRS